METLSPFNEKYRGYTIVSMVAEAEIRVLDGNDEYLWISDGDKQEVAKFFSYEHAKAYIDAQIRSGVQRDLSLPRTRIGINENKDFQLIISTPGGDIVVESTGCTNYPRASILINGHCVANVEWKGNSEHFNLYYYGTEKGVPQCTFENITDL